VKKTRVVALTVSHRSSQLHSSSCFVFGSISKNLRRDTAKCTQVPILFCYATDRCLANCQIFGNLKCFCSSCEQNSSATWLMFSSVRAIFSRPLPDFRTAADQRSSTGLQIDFTVPSFPPLPEIYQRLFHIPSQVPSLDPHFIFVWYFPHKIIKIITVTSNYAKFIKNVLSLFKRQQKQKCDVTLTLQASWNSGTPGKITNVHLWNLFLKFAFLPFRHTEK